MIQFCFFTQGAILTHLRYRGRYRFTSFLMMILLSLLILRKYKPPGKFSVLITITSRLQSIGSKTNFPTASNSWTDRTSRGVSIDSSDLNGLGKTLGDSTLIFNFCYISWKVINR